MYAVYEQASLRVSKTRAFGDMTFATLADAVAYFTNAGGYAEVDADGLDAADVYYRNTVYTVEAI